MLKESLLLITRTSSQLIFKFLILFIPIILINWIFIAVLGISTFSSISSDSALKLIPFIIILVLFIAGFPFLYFNIARQSAIKRSLNVLINKNKVVLIEYIISKLFENLKLKTIENKKVIEIIKQSKNFISLLGKLPKVTSWILNYFTSKIPFTEVLINFLETNSIDPENIDTASIAIANTINERFDLSIFDEKKSFYRALLLINLVIMILSAIYLG